MLKKTFLSVCLLISFLFAAGPSEAQRPAGYEYKIIKLGSLTSLQKKENPQTELEKIEALLNGPGAEGWEMVNLFAVRTTFDPNVFFVVMKRPLSRNGAADH